MLKQDNFGAEAIYATFLQHFGGPATVCAAKERQKVAFHKK
jgi:hypothetical protein